MVGGGGGGGISNRPIGRKNVTRCQRCPQSEVFFCDSGVDISNRPMGRMLHMWVSSTV